jgi:hypothetical protein
MRDYIILIVVTVAGVAVYFVTEVLPLLPRRVAYAMLVPILIALAIYLLLRPLVRV